MITTSALRTPEKWPGFLERARKAGFSPNFVLCRFDGTVLGEHSPGDPNFPSISTYRRKLHNLLYEYATDLGIRIDFEVNVREYLETPDHGGVVLANGERLTADVVVAADGVGSKSRLLVDPSNQDAPVSSGFIMYRVAFPIQPAMEKDALIAEYFADYPERGFLYVGPGAHLVLSKTFDDVCWLLTCKVSCATLHETCSMVDRRILGQRPHSHRILVPYH
jgi:2-polyprenyl-6-methoxyphenol hydroxylase-like FAD-dependent oxidoreductase